MIFFMKCFQTFSLGLGLLSFINFGSAFANPTHRLTPAAALHKISFLLTGAPAPKVLRKRWQSAPNEETFVRQALKEGFQASLWDTDTQQPNPGFAHWLINYHNMLFKVKIPRNLGLCTFCWWKPKVFTEFLKENKTYLEKFPERYNTEYMWGGSDFELPISTEKHPFDYPYYLYELEPAILATAVVLNDKPYTDILTATYTVRTPTLNLLSEAFPKADTTLAPIDNMFSVPHWTGSWQVVERPLEHQQYHAGVLTTRAYLQTYPKERTWANRAIYQNMLCHTIQPVDNPDNIAFQYYKEIDAHPLRKEGCANCHYMLDGLANLRNEFVPYKETKLNKWSDAYIYDTHHSAIYTLPDQLTAFNQNTGRSTYTQFPLEHYLLKESRHGFLTVHTMKELGFVLIQHPWFHSCVAKHLFQAIYGRDLDEKYEKDKWMLANAIKVFEHSNFNLKDLIFYFIQDPAFYETP